MVAANLNSLCEEAELYYYDFILGKGHELIPEHIVEHISQCRKCQEQVNELKGALLQADSIDQEQKQANSATATILKLHFACIGKPVTCQTVKPFLPTLLDPVLQIRIPTPITAHLDNCQRCSEDLEVIRSLRLNRKQLSRLSQLFAEVPSKDKVSCSQARAAILFVVLMTLREVDADVLKHICICPDCRKALYEYRQATCKEVENETEEKEFPCEQVSAADIFDYVVPYGLDPANDQYRRFRESLTSHIRKCPRCLAKMQQLHETVYSIAERADSEIVTVYNITEPTEARVESESIDLYKGFPISVDVIGPEKVRIVESPFDGSSIAALRQKLTATSLRPIIKAGIATAAALLIGIGLLLSTPSAKAVTIEQIYKTIEKVRNVYVASFVPEKKEPVQEKWVSRALNVYMTKTGDQLVLWDFQNKVKKTKHLDSSLAETTVLPNDIIAETWERIAGSLGLMPFDRMSAIPRDAEWHRVTDNSLKVVTENSQIYDLVWTERSYGGSTTFKKWRVFVDPETNLPQKVERYQRSATNGEYTLRSAMVVEYLSDSKMRDIIKGTSF
jgi:hypothetical protein